VAEINTRPTDRGNALVGLESAITGYDGRFDQLEQDMKDLDTTIMDLKFILGGEVNPARQYITDEETDSLLGDPT